MILLPWNPLVFRLMPDLLSDFLVIIAMAMGSWPDLAVMPFNRIVR